MTILIKNEEFNELKEILDELYMLPENFYLRHLLDKKYMTFSIFLPKECNFIENNLKPRNYSPLGSLVKDYSDNQVITFEEICEADAFLFIKSLTSGYQSDDFYRKR
ncbi:hypothetical protein [Acinetobacter seifertii]|uniref:hypothetical protein n=1 Tax=Acinetobacter seifertii TaxID=1530123 RepID=UPI001CC2DC80|nr:hypothetical protein [Acinetobacter seifertii]